MFGQPDVNEKALDKAPGGTWIVGPIIQSGSKSDTRRLYWYVSADAHRKDDGDPKKTRELETSGVMRAFQRSAIDLVTDVFEQIVLREIRERTLKLSGK